MGKKDETGGKKVETGGKKFSIKISEAQTQRLAIPKERLKRNFGNLVLVWVSRQP